MAQRRPDQEAFRNLVTLRRHIERRLSERVLKLETPGGGKVWGFKDPCSLYLIAAMHTEIVGDTAGKEVFLIPREYTRDCNQWYLDEMGLFLYDTLKDETAEEEAARFNEAEHSDAEEIYFYSELDATEYEDEVHIYLDCSEIIDYVLPTQPLFNFWYAATFEDCQSILALQTNGDGLSAVTFADFVKFDLSLVAALEPGNDRKVVSAFIRHFMRNIQDFIGDMDGYGEDYNRLFFDELENYQPHLLSRAAIREGMCAHLRKGLAQRWDWLHDYLSRILEARSPASGREEVTRIAGKLRAAWDNDKKAIRPSKKELNTLVDWHLEEHYREHYDE